MFAVVTLADGRRLRLDVADVAVYEDGGAPFIIVHRLPNGIVRAGHCREVGWADLCREVGIEPTALPDIG